MNFGVALFVILSMTVDLYLVGGFFVWMYRRKRKEKGRDC